MSHSPLIIERIETIALRVPLGQTYQGSHYKMTHRSPLIIRLYTSAGIIGQAYTGDEDSSLGQILNILNNEIGPRLIGEDACNIERCWQLTRRTTFDILRDRRLALVATAAVDAAIWDAYGQLLDEPLWKLWGGFRDRLPVIEIGGYYGMKVPLEDEVAEAQSRGVAGMKLKIGGRSPLEDAARICVARKTAGNDFVLMVDANQGWTPREAIEFVHHAEDLNIYWFEEPCEWHNDIAGMRNVRLSTGVRVCAGQSEHSAAGCRRLMESDAIDFCNFDASWSGGPTEWRRVAALAHTFDVAMAHHEEPQVASHLLASIPHGSFLETFSPDRDPVWPNLILNQSQLMDGMLQMPTSSGFGWALDESYIARYRVN